MISMPTQALVTSTVERIQKLLPRLPPLESTLLQRHYVDLEPIPDIAKDLDAPARKVRQVLEHAEKLMSFIESLPSVTEEDLRRDLPSVKIAPTETKEGPRPCPSLTLTPLDIGILVGLWKKLNQSVVARDNKILTTLVRWRLHRSIKLLEASGEPFKVYAQLFSIIAHTKIKPTWIKVGRDDKPKAKSSKKPTPKALARKNKA